MKICHVTSAHNRYDGRIFLKQCSSLAKKYDVTLICCDSLEDEVKKNVKIVSTHKKFKNRYERFLKSKKLLKKKCLQIDADIYQFHDSDLLGLALYMKKLKKKVIFDFHEDYESLFLEREWIPKFARNILLKMYVYKEQKTIPKFDYLIAAADHIKNKLKLYNENINVIENFPILDSNKNISTNVKKMENIICFAGGVNYIWNHDKVISSINNIDNITYKIAGNYTNEYYKYLSTIEGFDKVLFLGRLNHTEVSNLYLNSNIGIALCSYCNNVDYKNGSLGNTKIFEYMMYGLPVIFTDFKVFKKINENKQFGIAVNPYNKEEINNAIKTLLENPKLAKKLGNNGRKLIEEKYNWNILEKQLFNIYSKFELKEK